MLYLQVLLNGLALGGLYACIAAGFSLVWGVLNVINILHGSLIVLGGYLAYFAYAALGVSPFLFAPVAGLATFIRIVDRPALAVPPDDLPWHRLLILHGTEALPVVSAAHE